MQPPGTAQGHGTGGLCRGRAHGVRAWATAQPARPMCRRCEVRPAEGADEFNITMPREERGFTPERPDWSDPVDHPSHPAPDARGGIVTPSAYCVHMSSTSVPAPVPGVLGSTSPAGRPARSAAVVNELIRCLMLRAAGRLSDEQRAEYEDLLAEWAAAVRAEVVKAA